MDGSCFCRLLLLLTGDHDSLADHRDNGRGVNRRRDVKLASLGMWPQSAPANLIPEHRAPISCASSPALHSYDMTVMMLMKSPRACAAAGALVAILCFAAAPLARAQTETPVPVEIESETRQGHNPH